MQGEVPLNAALPNYAEPKGPQVAVPGLMTKVMNRSLKAKLPRLFSKGKHIESKSTIKIKEKKVKYW